MPEILPSDLDVASACAEVAEAGGRIVITRDGQPWVAVVPLDDLAWLQMIEDRHDTALLRRARAEWERSSRDAATLDEVLARLGIEAPASVGRDEILARLRALEAELRRMGVRSLALFGSVARGEDTPESDVDIVVSIEPEAKLSLLGFAGISRRLTDLLEREVDLVEREVLRPAFAQEVARDEVRVF